MYLNINYLTCIIHERIEKNPESLIPSQTRNKKAVLVYKKTEKSKVKVKHSLLQLVSQRIYQIHNG
jgi:hypothetical protein